MKELLEVVSLQNCIYLRLSLAFLIDMNIVACNPICNVILFLCLMLINELSYSTKVVKDLLCINQFL